MSYVYILTTFLEVYMQVCGEIGKIFLQNVPFITALVNACEEHLLELRLIKQITYAQKLYCFLGQVMNNDERKPELQTSWYLRWQFWMIFVIFAAKLMLWVLIGVTIIIFAAKHMLWVLIGITEAIPMNTHNICFAAKITKNIFQPLSCWII